MHTNQVIHGDCLIEMQKIPDKSIDMILCDLPYGTTACKWDTIIPFEPMWEQYKRIIKDNGAIVLTASQPFTSVLVMSNIEMFKFGTIWEKDRATNFLNFKYQPGKSHEDIIVFSKAPTSYTKNGGPMKYNPQMEVGTPYTQKQGRAGDAIARDEKTRTNSVTTVNEGLRYPKSVLKFSTETGLHPTQKPVALFEYLIKTYTNEGDLVLDNCAGSGTTGVACRNLNRNYILIEKEKEYIDIINKRLTKENN